MQIYAQGMSVAANTALLLGRELAAALAAVGGKASGMAEGGNAGGKASGKAGGKTAESTSSLEARRAAVQGMGPTFQKHLAAGKGSCPSVPVERSAAVAKLVGGLIAIDIPVLQWPHSTYPPGCSGGGPLEHRLL